VLTDALTWRSSCHSGGGQPEIAVHSTCMRGASTATWLAAHARDVVAVAGVKLGPRALFP